jgi:hypothetical protein
MGMSEVKTIERKICHERQELVIVDNALVWPPGESPSSSVVEQRLREMHEWNRWAREMVATTLRASVGSATSDEKR